MTRRSRKGPRLLHCADLHLGTFRRIQIPFEAKMDRYKAILQFIFMTAIKKKVDYIVIAGDIFEHKNPHPKVKDLLLQAILHYDSIPIIMIPGNHDEVERGYTTLRFLSILQSKGKLPHLYFTETEPKVIYFDDINFALIPYTGDNKRYGYRVKTLISGIPSNKPIVVVGHEMVKGVDDDSGWVAKTGVRLPKLNRVTYWAMGDIHKQQSLSGLPNAWYPGSPAQHKFSEAPNKGVLIVNTEDPHNPVHVPNTHPKVKTLHVIDSDDPADLVGIPKSEWISLKTSNIEVMREMKVNIVKNTPRKASSKNTDTNIDVKVSVSDPLSYLKPWLETKMGFSDKDAEEAYTIARGLI